jgi:hypothetical protein
MKNILCLPLLLALISTALPAAAGTLDKAPFKISVPAGPWLLVDSAEQNVGPNAFLEATLAQTNSTLRAIVIRTGLEGVTASSMKDLLAGIRDSLTRPDIKNLAEQDVTFVGIKARQFTYEVTQNGVTVYSDTIVFISGNDGWTIDCVGPLDRQDEVKKMLGCFRAATH